MPGTLGATRPARAAGLTPAPTDVGDLGDESKPVVRCVRRPASQATSTKRPANASTPPAPNPIPGPARGRRMPGTSCVPGAARPAHRTSPAPLAFVPGTVRLGRTTDLA